MQKRIIRPSFMVINLVLFFSVVCYQKYRKLGCYGPGHCSQ